MFRFAPLAALTLAATPAFAEAIAPVQPSAQLRRSQVLLDATGARLGAIDSVAADGTIGLIVDGKYVRLPGSVITNVGGKPKTSLTKKDLKALR